MVVKRNWNSAVARILSRKSQGVPAKDAIVRLAQHRRQVIENSCNVDLRGICSQLGVEIRYEPLALDGILLQTESGYVATINSSDSKFRQRFSIAHEIGHIELYNTTSLTEAFGHLSPHDRKNSDAIEVEHLCDHFAAELLLPLHECRACVWQEGLSVSLVKKLVTCYRVSTSVAARRVIEAAPWNCAIVIWEPVYEEGSVREMRPIRYWQNIRANGRPTSLPNSSEFFQPGSPFHTLTLGKDTRGVISSPYPGMRGEFFAHSAIVGSHPTRIATLIVPARYGFEITLPFNQRH